jgi:hypothetical protein
MLNFSSAFRGETTLRDLVAALTVDDLGREMDEFYDQIERLLAECDDFDVIFQPVDPEAKDDAAASAEEVNIAWTLAHVVVHVTAGNEEQAALAAEMARGVEYHGRSRYEVPWESVTTIAALRHRVAESRRMCLASLGMWPDEPHLDVITEAFPGGPQVDAKARFALGLAHGYSHVEQVKEIIRQAKAARGEDAGR